MIFVGCSSYLLLSRVTLVCGATVDLPEVEGEELALAGKPLVPYDHVDFEIDNSPECAEKLNKAYAEYRSLLQQAAVDETTKSKET